MNSLCADAGVLKEPLCRGDRQRDGKPIQLTLKGAGNALKTNRTEKNVTTKIKAAAAVAAIAASACIANAMPALASHFKIESPSATHTIVSPAPAGGWRIQFPKPAEFFR
jgi:hypothetical protein